MKNTLHINCLIPAHRVIRCAIMASFVLSIYAEAAITTTIPGTNRIRLLFEDGFGNTLTNYNFGLVDGNEPAVGAPLNLYNPLFAAGLNYQPLGIYPFSTPFFGNTLGPPFNAPGDGAITSGGYTTGFNNINPTMASWGVFFTANTLLGQFDSLPASKFGPARIRIDVASTFLVDPLGLAAGGNMGVFLNLFGKLPLLGDWAAGKAQVTVKGVDPLGVNYSHTISSLAGGDPGAPVFLGGTFWYEENTTGLPEVFFKNISNSIVFPGAFPMSLLEVQGFLELFVDPADVTFDVTGPTYGPPIPEPSTSLLSCLVAPLALVYRRRRRDAQE